MESYKIPMDANDASALTVGEYLWQLGKCAWDEKRPFGNSGWEYELAEALFKAGKLKKAGYETITFKDHSYQEFEYDSAELWSVLNDIYNEMWNKINE